MIWGATFTRDRGSEWWLEQCSKITDRAEWAVCCWAVTPAEQSSTPQHCGSHALARPSLPSRSPRYAPSHRHSTHSIIFRQQWKNVSLILPKTFHQMVAFHCKGRSLDDFFFKFSGIVASFGTQSTTKIWSESFEVFNLYLYFANTVGFPKYQNANFHHISQTWCKMC